MTVEPAFIDTNALVYAYDAGAGTAREIIASDGAWPVHRPGADGDGPRFGGLEVVSPFRSSGG